MNNISFNLGLSIFSLMLVLISLPVLYILRWWAYNSAFEGMSKTGRRKILKEQSQLRKHTLFFLLEYKNPVKTKRKIAFYYSYIFIILTFLVLLVLRVKENVLVNEVQWIWTGKLLLDVVIGLVFLRQTGPKK